jgi:carbon storage regulator CsrA
MLVLSRRIGEQIRIGKSVVVTLLKVERNRARIGVTAPPGIPVYRQELLDFDSSRPPLAARESVPDHSVAERDPFRPSAGSGIASRRFLWDTATL